MTKTPLISRVLIVPGLPVSPDDSPQNTHVCSLSIGLVIDNKQAFWSEYRPDPEKNDAWVSLQQQIVPLLEGRTLEEYREIMDELDGLAETAVLIPTPSLPPTPSGTVSRRGFLTGKLETAVKTQQVVVERPLSPSLRCGISQALLTALAAARQLTVTQLITTEYGLPLRLTPIPLHLNVGEAAVPDSSLLTPSVQSLGYQVDGRDPQSQLGSNGEKLQHFIRRLTQLLKQTAQPDYRPAIHLKLAGSLGALFDNKIGQVLGAVYGLEQAAKPYPLRLSDPILTDDLAQQNELMRQLADLIRMRGMQSRLAASSHVQSLTAVTQIVESRAAHMIELSPSRLGTIQQSIRAVQLCRQGETAVLLQNESQPFTSQFALAVQPDLLMAGWEPDNFHKIDQICREMAKVITFLTQISA